MEDDRFAFEVEWFDAQAELMRRYTFTYFVRESGSNEIEMVRGRLVAVCGAQSRASGAERAKSGP